MHPLMLELLPWVRQGYCCSQLLLLLLLQARGRRIPDWCAPCRACAWASAMRTAPAAC